MFAVIETGSKQLRVTQGAVLTVDYQEGLNKGDKLTLGSVLLANGGGSSIIGKPLIDGAAVEVEVVDPLLKGEKVEIQKFRRRKNSRRHTGHRQKYTTVRVTAINIPGLEIVEKKEEQPA